MAIVAAITLSALAAFVPTVIYTWAIWWFDRYEKEPLWLLLVTFLWGAVPAVVISFVVEIAFGLPLSVLGEVLAGVVETSAVAPVVEEGAKGLALFGLWLAFQREFDGVLDGIIYGALVGFGFAMTENFLYFAGTFMKEGWGAWAMVVLLRAVVFGLNHAFFTSITGAALGYARLATATWQRVLMPLLGLATATFFHAVHNLFTSLVHFTCFGLLISLLSDWGGVFVILVVMLLAWRQEKGWIRQELDEEVSGGILSSVAYEMVSSYRRRLAAQWRVLEQQGWRKMRLLSHYSHLATELAFRKHRWRTLGDEGRNVAEIAHFREKLLLLSGEVGQLLSEEG